MAAFSRVVARVMLLALAASITVAAQAAVQGRDRSPPDEQRVSEQLIEMRLNGGELQKALLVVPQHARGAIVMLPGGSGDVGLGAHTDVRHDDNFVVRTRMRWAQRGFMIVIPDAIDHINLRGVRSLPGYASLVGDLVDLAHKKLIGPVFLLGTSQGSIAAMNAGAHAAPGSIAGVVLTESVSVMGASGETVFSANPQRVRAPALIVANRDDRCNVAPPQSASRIARAMTGSRDVQVLIVSGGSTRSSRACGSLTPHGYYGIEASVVGKIASWMDAHSGRSKAI